MLIGPQQACVVHLPYLSRNFPQGAGPAPEPEAGAADLQANL